MWKLKNVNKEHWEQFVLVGEECSVGRKDSTLLLSNDPSISRKHASMFVKHPVENVGNASKKSSLFMRDEKSKYGTYKNGVKVTNEVELADGDVVKFGQFESEFRVHYVPLIVTTSCLDVSSKNNLKNFVHLLGGHLVSEWQTNCTHLVMSEIKVTVKALCCLVSLKPIVKPDYFEELLKSLKSSSSVLSPKEFLPPIGEFLIDRDQVSFHENPLRRNLFKDKTFLFLDEKQLKKLQLGIVAGGGKTSLISESNTDVESVINENACVIEPMRPSAADNNSGFLRNIFTTLQKKNLRPIPESDIGLAVAYASTERFCNPTFDNGSFILGSPRILSQSLSQREVRRMVLKGSLDVGASRIPSQTLSQKEVYAPDTQESILGKSSTSKRDMSSDDDLYRIKQASKRQKFEAPDSLSLTNFKAEPLEILEIPPSPEKKIELDDVFEVGAESACVNNDDEIVELPTTQPMNVEPATSQRRTRSNKEKFDRDKSPVPAFREGFPAALLGNNKRKIESITKSPKKMKIERNVSIVNHNGHNTVNENGNDDNLPRNLAKVQYADLVVRRHREVVPLQNVNSNVKNFKKFKKVNPVKSSVLPRIIGGHDLVPYDKDAAKFQSQWEEEVDARVQTVVKGAFDW